MSKEVKRWSHHVTWEGSQIAATMMALRDDGQFVSWDDCDALRTELAEANADFVRIANERESLLAERDRLKEALAAMLGIHGVTQRYADTHIEIPQSWVDVSDFARAALQGEQP